MSKEKFMKVYANLPVPEREQIIAVIDDEPYSWKQAYNEIQNDTNLGEKILEQLKLLGVL